MLKEIGRNMPIGKLDSLFLLIPALLGLSLTVTASTFRGWKNEEVIMLTASLLVIAVVWPIYVGYIRGGIIMNDILERARGWIYLSIGVVIYLWNMAVYFVSVSSLYRTVALSVFGLAIIGAYQ